MHEIRLKLIKKWVLVGFRAYFGIFQGMESQMPERIADARYHKRIITISKELDFPNHLGNPYDGCLSLDIRLTVFLSAFWSHFGDRCCLIDKQDNKFVNIVCLDGYVYNQSNYLWLLLIVVAFVENDDSRHVHGELDYFEGLQYTLSSFILEQHSSPL